MMDTIHAIVSLKDWAARISGGEANLPQVPGNRRQGDTALQGVLRFCKDSKLGSAWLLCLSSASSLAAVRDQPVPDLWSAWTVHWPFDCGVLVLPQTQLTFQGTFPAPHFSDKIGCLQGGMAVDWAPHFSKWSSHSSSNSEGQDPNVVSIMAITNLWGPSPCHLSENCVRPFIAYDEHHFTSHLLQKRVIPLVFCKRQKIKWTFELSDPQHTGRGKMYHLAFA